MNKLEIYVDGGSRGNPGPAAVGFIINEKEYAEFIGEETNNTAEYKAIIFALKKTRHLLGKEKLKNTEVIVYSDSDLVVNQLNGKYKILEKELMPLFIEVWNLKFDFPNLKFVHIEREKNKRADRLVNQCLDKASLDKLF
ncbi:MAG: ribonuclease HI family protein [Minisyncoccia bacterium]